MRKQPLESSLQADVINLAHARGYFAEKIVWPGRNGCPDVYVAARKMLRSIVDPTPTPTRIHFLIECKQQDEEATEQQAFVHAELIRAGVMVYVVDTLQQASFLLPR